MTRVGPPRVTDLGGTAVEVAFAAAGGLPGRTGRAALHGRRELVLVDPGDPSDAVLDAIEAVVRGRDGAIRAIVLTTTDPDHAAGAEAVAIPLEIPILVAPGAGPHLPYDDASRSPTATACRPMSSCTSGSVLPGSGRLEVVRRQRGSDAPRLRRKLRPSSTSFAGAYGPGIRKHGRPASATPVELAPRLGAAPAPATISAARL